MIPYYLIPWRLSGYYWNLIVSLLRLVVCIYVDRVIWISSSSKGWMPINPSDTGLTLTTGLMSLPAIQLAHLWPSNRCWPSRWLRIPAKTYTCPLCPLQVDRKEHQVDRLTCFPFVPDKDILPGKFGHNHYFSEITMDFALQTHFPRASCPVLFCQRVFKQHFGEINSLPSTAPTQVMMMEDVPDFAPYGLLPLAQDPGVRNHALEHRILGICSQFVGVHTFVNCTRVSASLLVLSLISLIIGRGPHPNSCTKPWKNICYMKRIGFRS